VYIYIYIYVYTIHQAYSHKESIDQGACRHCLAVVTVVADGKKCQHVTLVDFCRLTEEDEEETIEKPLSTELAKKHVQYGLSDSPISVELHSYTLSYLQSK